QSISHAFTSASWTLVTGWSKGRYAPRVEGTSREARIRTWSRERFRWPGERSTIWRTYSSPTAATVGGGCIGSASWRGRAEPLPLTQPSRHSCPPPPPTRLKPSARARFWSSLPALKVSVCIGPDLAPPRRHRTAADVPPSDRFFCWIQARVTHLRAGFGALLVRSWHSS